MCPSQLVTHTTNPTHTNSHQKQKRPHQTPTRQRRRQEDKQSQKPITDDEPDVAVHTTHYKDARVHYPDLKQQPHTRTTPTHSDTAARTTAGHRKQTSSSREPKPQTPPTGHQGGGLILQNPNSVPPPTPANRNRQGSRRFH